MNRYAYLFEGLTLKRVAWVSMVCVWAAAATVWFFLNTYLDLLVSALCVGYTSMLLFTMATNLRQRSVPREVVQVAAIIVGSVLGTILAGVVKGRSFAVFSQGGKFFVIDDVCPHRGGSLGEGLVDAAGTVACPWHGWRFNIATGQSPVNPTARVPCFNVRVEAGWVEAEI